MDMLYNILFFVAGIAVDFMYHHARRVGECKAYREGYEQARYEEKIRGERPYELHTTPQPMPKTNTYTLPKLFERRLNDNGQATMKLK